MNEVSAFSPANISLLFTVCQDPDPRKMGSTGLGCTLDEGVTGVVSLSEANKIFWNETEINLAPVNYVVQHLTAQQVTVRLTSKYPLGCGFGLSGASALATAYALNALLNRGKNNLELAKLAHTAEVISKTGLGDVANQFFGGMCLKSEVSSKFIVTRLPFTDTVIYYKVFSQYSTESLLSDKNKISQINSIGGSSIEKIRDLHLKEELTFKQLLDLSYEFCEISGLIEHPDVRSTIDAIHKQKNAASMILIGNAVISDAPFEGAETATISERHAQLL